MRRTGPLAILLGVLLALPSVSQARTRSPGADTLIGTVTAPTGQALGGAEVRFYPEDFRTGGDEEGYVESTWTRSDGTFSIEVNNQWGLPDGSYLVSVVDDSGTYPETWYLQAAAPEGATVVTVASGTQPPALAITMRNPVPPATVSGSVRGNGTALNGVDVFAYAASGSQWDDPAASVATDASGGFVLPVEPGSYRIVADGSPYGLLKQWWRGSAAFEQAAVVDVGEGAAVSGLSFDLSVQQTFPVKPKGKLKAPATRFSFGSVGVDPIEPYQGQKNCRAKPRKGTVALRDLLLSTYGSQEGAGLNRACTKDTSEHYDGRAIDWMVNSRIPAQARKGDSFTYWATKTRGKEAGAMARRLGIMYLIWRGKIWKQYDASAGWQVYMKCDRKAYLKPSWDNDCHRNHVHISLTQRGARLQTSWWTGTPSS